MFPENVHHKIRGLAVGGYEGFTNQGVSDFYIGTVKVSAFTGEHRTLTVPGSGAVNFEDITDENRNDIAVGFNSADYLTTNDHLISTIDNPTDITLEGFIEDLEVILNNMIMMNLNQQNMMSGNTSNVSFIATPSNTSSSNNSGSTSETSSNDGDQQQNFGLSGHPSGFHNQGGGSGNGSNNPPAP